MKIALVSVNMDRQDPTYPLGLMILATHVRRKLPEATVTMLDANFDDIERRAVEDGYDIIGVSAMTVDYGKATAFAEKVRPRTQAPLIVGGVHISTLPASLHPCFDIGVVGEGEETFLALVRLFAQHGRFTPNLLKDVAGIVYRDGQKLTETPRRDLITLDETILPDWSFINPAYFKKRPVVSWADYICEMHLLTARGCPYECIFCSTTQMWRRKIRFHSAEYVVAAVKDLMTKHRVTHIQVYDDLFAVNRPRLRRIAELLHAEGLLSKVKFFCSLRANLVDDELCELLVALNVKMVFFGFESGNERMLHLLKGGNVTVEQNRHAIRTCVKHGIRVHGSVIFGSPTETLAEMRDTLSFVDFAVQAGALRIIGFVMTPYPKTKVWDMAKAQGKVSEDMDWTLLTQINEDNPLLLEPDVPVAEFKQIMIEFRHIARAFQREKFFMFLRNSPIGLIRFAIEYSLSKLGF